MLAQMHEKPLPLLQRSRRASKDGLPQLLVACNETEIHHFQDAVPLGSVDVPASSEPRRPITGASSMLGIQHLRHPSMLSLPKALIAGDDDAIR